MTFETAAIDPIRTAAEIIDRHMKETGFSNTKLAKILETTPSVIAAIRSGRLPVPLAWLPTIGRTIKYDPARLMTVAIADQGQDLIVAIAEALVWHREQIEEDWLDLITEFGGGEIPDPQDVPKIVKALREAIGDSADTH
jgi:hypothetical protein